MRHSPKHNKKLKEHIVEFRDNKLKEENKKLKAQIAVLNKALLKAMKRIKSLTKHSIRKTT